MKLSKPRFMYAVCYDGIYRFKYADWVRCIKDIASNIEVDIDDYAQKLGPYRNLTDILPEEAEELLNDC